MWPDGLLRTLNGFGGDLQTGQDLDLPAVVIEGRRSPDDRQHAAHAEGTSVPAMSSSSSAGNCPDDIANTGNRGTRRGGHGEHRLRA
jgi:hypothetical protein